MSGKTKAQLQAEIRSLRAKVASISRYRLRAECECDIAKTARDKYYGWWREVYRKKQGRAICKNCSYLWHQGSDPYCMKHQTKIDDKAVDTATCGDFKA